MNKTRFAKREANRVLRLKLELEKTFNRDLRSYFAKQRSNIKNDNMIDSISPVLQKHYSRIIKAITGIAIKQTTDENLLNQFEILLDQKALLRGLEIDKTTEEVKQKSIDSAREALAKDGVNNPGIALLLLVASRIFANYNINRVSTISISETQNVVEGTRKEINDVTNQELSEAVINGDKEKAKELYDLSGSYSAYYVWQNIDIIPIALLLAGLMQQQKE